MLLPPALGSSPHPPVSVYGTGTASTIAAFLGAWLTVFPTLIRSPSRLPILPHGFSSVAGTPLGPGSPLPAPALHTRPRSSVLQQCRNFHLLSIGYGFRPRLRPRLTQGRSALPWKPWIFGHMDSHHILATHSGILPSAASTRPFGRASPAAQCSPTNAFAFPSFGGAFQPRTFSARSLSASELLRTL